jgi:hypothetical protein
MKHTSKRPAEDVHYFELSKKQLLEIPPDVRRFVFAGAHLLNEINMLEKLAYFCSRPKQKAAPFSSSQMAQTSILARLLFGKFNEGWELIKRYSHVRKDYRKSDEAAKAWDEIAAYFNKKNEASRIRNNLAFHYNPEALEDAFMNISEDYKLSAVLSYANGNTLVTFVEDLCTVAAIGRESTLATLLCEGLRLSKLFRIYLTHYVPEIMNTHSPNIFNVARGTPIDLSECPVLTEVSIPFLVRVPTPEQAEKG